MDYVFEKSAADSVFKWVRCIALETDEETGGKSVFDILEMGFDGSKESLKKTVKCLYEMFYIGEDEEDYTVQAAFIDYDSSLAGKARKQSSKDINVITEQLAKL